MDAKQLQAYEWCGTSGYAQSGYINLQANASNYNIPIFLSETGCIMPEPRYFDDQHAIFGPEMDGTWSGAIIYEWIQEANGYGLISYGPTTAATATGSSVVGGYSVMGTPTPISPDFTNLMNQWATLNPSGVSANAYSPSLTPPACPPYTSGGWLVSGNAPLPTLGVTGGQYTKTFTAASASSTTSSSSAATATRSSSRGLSAIERQFTRWSLKSPTLFYGVGIVCSIAGAALML